MLTATEIEDGILETLRADEGLASYCRVFQPIPSLDPEQLEKLFTVFPAVGVIAGGGDYVYHSSLMVEDRGLFYVLCFQRNLRGETAAVHGDGLEVGVWEMVEDCRRALSGGTLSLAGVMGAVPQARRLLFAGDKWAAASLEVLVRWGG